MKKLTLPLLCLALAFSVSGYVLIGDPVKAAIFFGIIIILTGGFAVWLLRVIIKKISKLYQWQVTTY